MIPALEVNLARECPRFPSCSVNRCPLEEGYPNQVIHPDDREKRCTMEKGVRMRISATSPGLLALGGLKVAEHAGIANWEEKPTAVKIEVLKRCKAALAAQNRAFKGKSTKPTTEATKP